jgi:osmotically-inducible protein OsmY
MPSFMTSVAKPNSCEVRSAGFIQPTSATGSRVRVAMMVCSLGLVATTLTGCFPVVATGVVVGAMSVADRRTTGAQTDDQAIEIKAFNRLRENSKTKAASLSVVSFNRIALLTGYAPDAATRAEALEIVKRIENVREVLNEVTLGPKPSLATYSGDVIITTRVKSALLSSQEVKANTVKVYTESGIVYLMGIVSEREARAAAVVASKISGVRRVVRAFEVISETDLQNLERRLQTSGSGAATAPVETIPSASSRASGSGSAPASASAGAAVPETLSTPTTSTIPTGEVPAVVTPIR